MYYFSILCFFFKKKAKIKSKKSTVIFLESKIEHVYFNLELFHVTKNRINPGAHN